MINWPVLSSEQIESTAEQFRNEALDALGIDRSTLPVPVEKIAEYHLGYTLDFIQGESDILGGIDFNSLQVYLGSCSLSLNMRAGLK